MSLPPGLAREVVGYDRRGKPILGQVVKTKDAAGRQEGGRDASRRPWNVSAS
jgi:hypothetical protein